MASTPSEPTAKVIGLLEVKISGISGGTPTAQTRWLEDSRRVGAQAIALSPDLPRFTTRNVQVFDLSDNEGGITRHISAVLEVYNTTSVFFDQLMLYPLNRPAVTLGGTAISAIQTPTGVSLTDPALARSMRPTHTMQGAGLGVAVNPAQAHLQWLTIAEVGEVKAALPALGFAANVEPLQYAFVARNLNGGNDPRRLLPNERGFTALAYAFPRPQDRAQSPDTLVLQFVVGNDPTLGVSQGLEEHGVDTVAGLAQDSPIVRSQGEVRVLLGSQYAGANRRQLCRVVVAGSLANPLVTLGDLPPDQSDCAVSPVAPTGFNTTDLSYRRLTLRWDTVLESTSYVLERGLGQNPETWIQLTPQGNSSNDSGLEPNTTYTYRVRSQNANGLSSWTRLTLTTKAIPFIQETVLENIGDIPWSLNFAPDGTLLYTLRNKERLQLGRLNLASNTATPVLSDPPISVRVGEEGRYNEGGLMGMELDPDFARNNQLYVCYAYWLDGVQRPENRYIRVSRLELVGETLTNERVLIDRIEGTDIHSGCRVVVQGGVVFASTGDGTQSQGSQSLDKLSGKILRVTTDGSIPADNPDWDNNPNTSSPIWTIGHRNPQGLAFQPSTGLLWSTEHGPFTRDEVNIIRPGRNYGWPHCLGTQPLGSTFTAPEFGGTQTFDCTLSPVLTERNYAPALREYDPERSVAISDLLFYPTTGAAFPQWRGDVLFVTLRTGRLYRMLVNQNQIIGDEILIDPPLLPDPLSANAAVRLRDVVVDPNGWIYLSSDNGSIMRLRPIPNGR